MASTLERLSLDELRAMLTFRWQVASGGAKHPFTEEAIGSVFEHASGMPREANILADNALLLAYYQRSPIISDDLVRQVATDRQQNLARKEITR